MPLVRPKGSLQDALLLKSSDRVLREYTPLHGYPWSQNFQLRSSKSKHFQKRAIEHAERSANMRLVSNRQHAPECGRH